MNRRTFSRKPPRHRSLISAACLLLATCKISCCTFTVAWHSKQVSKISSRGSSFPTHWLCHYFLIINLSEQGAELWLSHGNTLIISCFTTTANIVGSLIKDCLNKRHPALKPLSLKPLTNPKTVFPETFDQPSSNRLLRLLFLKLLTKHQPFFQTTISWNLWP